ncbi:MAG: hypothetical protein WCK67_00615 [bacterium]
MGFDDISLAKIKFHSYTSTTSNGNVQSANPFNQSIFSNSTSVNTKTPNSSLSYNNSQFGVTTPNSSVFNSSTSLNYSTTNANNNDSSIFAKKHHHAHHHQHKNKVDTASNPQLDAILANVDNYIAQLEQQSQTQESNNPDNQNTDNNGDDDNFFKKLTKTAIPIAMSFTGAGGNPITDAIGGIGGLFGL